MFKFDFDIEEADVSNQTPIETPSHTNTTAENALILEPCSEIPWDTLVCRGHFPGRIRPQSLPVTVSPIPNFILTFAYSRV
jgi:hypothetical protein